MGILFTWSCPTKISLSTLTISSKLFGQKDWNHSVPFIRALWGIFKCFSNLGIWWLHLNIFINLQSKSCGLLACIISAIHLSKFVQMDLKGILKIIFIAIHCWGHWEVGAPHYSMNLDGRALKLMVSLCIHFSSVGFTQAFSSREAVRQKSSSPATPLLSWYFWNLIFLILNLQRALTFPPL